MIEHIHSPELEDEDDDESWERHPDAVKLANGEIRLRHKGKNGSIKLETIAEREARLQHNLYVKFSRTFESFLSK